MTKVTETKLAEIKPDATNANRHTERGEGMIRQSINKYGFAEAGTLDKDNNVIGGNLRTEASTDLGMEDAIIVDVDGTKPIYLRRNDLSLTDPDDSRARELAYALNRVAQVSIDFDPSQVLADLDAGVDLAGLFREDELSEILGELAKEPQDDPGPQVDKAAELQAKWGTSLGQIWELGEHRLACGDCTDKAVVESVMRGDKADLGVTSPPYAVGKEYEIGISFDEHLALLRGVADRALEVIKVGGFFFVNFGEIAAQSHSKPLTGSDRQCLYLISKDYWQIFHEERKMDLYAQRIWYKPFNRLQQPFWTYHTSIPHYQEWEHIWTWRLPGGNSDEVYDWDISSRAVWDTRNEAIDDKPLTRHVAAFPVGIPERAIKAHSAIGAIVWEPFCGSGTTLIACEQLGRKARGIEIDPGYVGVTLERWHTMTGKDPVLIK